MIINSVQDELAPRVREELESLGIDSPVIIPRDEEIYQYDLEGRPLVELPDDSEAVMTINNLMDEILSAGKVGV